MDVQRAPGFIACLVHHCVTLAFSFPFFRLLSLFLLLPASNPRLSGPLPSCDFKGRLSGLAAYSAPHTGSDCVLLLLFPSSHLSLPHTNFTVSHIKTCTMALRVSFLGRSVVATEVQLYRLENSHILWHGNKKKQKKRGRKPKVSSLVVVGSIPQLHVTFDQSCRLDQSVNM